MQPLRFCFLTTFYPPYSFGGDGIAVQRLARALVARGSEVTVVHDIDAFNALHDGPEPVDNGVAIPGVRVVPLRSRLGRLSVLLTQQLGRPTIHARRLRRLFASNVFDVVVFHNISLLGGPGLLAYGGDAVKLYLAHDHWLVCPTHTLWRHNREVCTGKECFRCVVNHRRPPQLWRWTGYLKSQLQHVDAFVAMSRFSRDKHREFGFPMEMEVLSPFLQRPPSVADPAADSPHERPYFIAVGRLEPMKGFDDLIGLFDRYPNADLLIAGDGGHASALHALAAHNPSIRLLGRMDPEKLGRYYRHAIALVVPSKCFETFGMTIIEAFRQGTPVLARNLGPFPDLLKESKGGALFDSNDDLLEAMHRMQHDTEYRAERSRAAFHAFSDRWAEDVIVPQFLELAYSAASRKLLPWRPELVRTGRTQM